MYFSDEMVRAAEARYGKPATYQMTYAVSEREVDIIRGSQRRHRKFLFHF